MSNSTTKATKETAAYYVNTYTAVVKNCEAKHYMLITEAVTPLPITSFNITGSEQPDSGNEPPASQMPLENLQFPPVPVFKNYPKVKEPALNTHMSLLIEENWPLVHKEILECKVREGFDIDKPYCYPIYAPREVYLLCEENPDMVATGEDFIRAGEMNYVRKDLYGKLTSKPYNSKAVPDGSGGFDYVLSTSDDVLQQVYRVLLDFGAITSEEIQDFYPLKSSSSYKG